MKPASLFRLPILWMFLGPPVFRVESLRDSMSSVRGEQDIWNIIRVLWWTFWGLVALVELARSHVAFKSFLRGLGTLPVWVGLWLVGMLVSTAVSPSPSFTAANSVMLVMLVLAAADLALKLHLGRLTTRSVLRALLVLSVVLLCVVGLTWLVSPERVGLSGRMTTGIRIRGQGLAYVPMVSLIVIYLGIHLGLTNGRRRDLWLALTAIAFGLWFVYLGKTRVAYLGCVVGLGFYAWHLIPPRRRVLSAVVALSLAGSAGVVAGFLYDASWTFRWKMDRAYERYVLRDDFAIADRDLAKQSFLTLNGRTIVQAALISETVTRPLGLGYIAGTRSYLDQLYRDGMLSVPLEGAHNTYLETWAGSGYLGFLGYLMLIGWVAWRASRFRSRSPDVLALRVLLLAVLFEGLFENEMAFPFHQSSVLFWIMAAGVAALSLPTGVDRMPLSRTRRRLARRYAS